MQRLGVLLLAVIVLGSTGWAWQDYSQRIDRVPLSEATAVSAEEPPRPPVMLVIGDSYVGGSAMNSGPTWPTLMGTEQGWIVIKDGIGGTGYVNGDTDEAAFLDRIEEDCAAYVPDLVLVAGGINDAGKYPASDIASVAARTIGKLKRCEPDAEVVMLSPFAPASVTPPTAELVSVLADVAEAERVDYIEVTDLLTGRHDLVGSDGVHPNDDGHAFLADRIGAALEPLVEAAASSP